jgi:ferredoxin--NADP+ reductase
MTATPVPRAGDELPAEQIASLRARHYNATLASFDKVHSDLAILRVVPDGGLVPFVAGQYVSLGLGNWEPRVEGIDSETLDAAQRQRLSKRAYSISCSLLDDAGSLRRVQEFPFLEFYVALVRHAARRPPALTPRLFALTPGAHLLVEPRAMGHYTLAGIPPDVDVVFFATGTGEAPHNAMIAELLAGGHRGRIASAVCVRERRDAGYEAVHRELARRFPNYRYFVLTTREPENLDPAHPYYVGKQYLQDIVRSGQFEREAQLRLDPARSHVFLCGSPGMIGLGPQASPTAPLAGSMLELLQSRGFVPVSPARPGNLHFERYW